MNITFTFDTSNQRDTQILNKIVANLTDLVEAKQAAEVAPASPEPVEASAVATSPEPVIDMVADKPKRGRKPKAETAEPETKPEPPEVKSGQEWAAVGKSAESAGEAADSSQSTDAASASGEPSKPITLDDVRGALQAFTAQKGVPAGIELLKQFNAGRISELEAANYAAFVEACQA